MLRNNDQRRNYPIEFAQQSLFPSNIAERLAHIDQPDRYCDNATDTCCCRTYEQLQQLHGDNQTAIDNDDWNCYVLNAAPKYDQKKSHLKPFTKQQTKYSHLTDLETNAPFSLSLSFSFSLSTFIIIIISFLYVVVLISTLD
jgi:hypothetical protein